MIGLRSNTEFLLKISDIGYRDTLCGSHYSVYYDEEFISYLLETSIPLCLNYIDNLWLEHFPELKQRYEKSIILSILLDISQANKRDFYTDISLKRQEEGLEYRLLEIDSEINTRSVIKCFINHFEYWGEPQLDCPNIIPEFIAEKFDLFLDSMNTKKCLSTDSNLEELLQDFAICQLGDEF